MDKKSIVYIILGLIIVFLAAFLIISHISTTDFEQQTFTNFVMDVPTHDGQGPLGGAGDGHEHHLPDGVDDRHDAHVQVPAEELQGGVVHDLHGAVGAGHGKVGQAQAHDAPHDRPLEPHAPQPQLQNRPLPRQEAQDPGRGGRLGEDRGQGRAPHPHVQAVDEDGVQHDVAGRADAHGDHAEIAEALGVDKGVHAQADHDEEAPQDIHRDVGVGIGEGVVAGAEGIEHRPPDGQHHAGQHHPQDQQHGEGVAHDGLRLFRVPLAPGDGAQRRAAGAAEVGEGRHDGDDGKAQPQTRQGQHALCGQAADEHAVHDVVQHVHDLGNGHGDGHAQDVGGDAPLGKVVFRVFYACHVFSLSKLTDIDSIPHRRPRFNRKAPAVPRSRPAARRAPLPGRKIFPRNPLTTISSADILLSRYIE